jgi:ribosomal protein RSM22 (predicted rRNA methylase)
MSCPMKSDSWCHFSQRSDRLEFQKVTKKGMTLSYEDEKYSYIILVKKDVMKREMNEIYKRNNSRIMTPPKMKSGHTVRDDGINKRLWM